MTTRWSIIGTVLVTILSVVFLAPDALRGSVWSWVLILLVIALPIGAASQIRDLRRRSLHDLADEHIRWTYGLAVTVALVLAVNEARIEEVHSPAAGEPTHP